jgi:hypothetical protein
MGPKQPYNRTGRASKAVTSRTAPVEHQGGMAMSEIKRSHQKKRHAPSGWRVDPAQLKGSDGMVEFRVTDYEWSWVTLATACKLVAGGFAYVKHSFMIGPIGGDGCMGLMKSEL